MIASTDHKYNHFDTLISNEQSFSIYRLPGSHGLTFILQQKGSPEYLLHLSDLNNKEGFVIAPFELSDETPLVLVHPDLVLEGEKAILTFLETIPLNFETNTKPTIDNVQTYSFSTYEKAFDLFQSALHSNSCEKIVLSRILDKPRGMDFSAGKTFKAACDAYPEAFVYLCHTPKTGTWLGSSPEVILSGEHTNWHTEALAGTRSALKKDDPDEWNEKNIKEQNIVSEYLEKELDARHLVYTKRGPFTAKAGNLMHLKTAFSFQMNDKEHLGDLLESLHPTPAVCGFPKENAYKLILKEEGYKRLYYSGFIGKLSIHKNTDLFVNLRCMKIHSDRLTLFAGGGLLPSSELQSEWEETEEKLQTMLSLIDY